MILYKTVKRVVIIFLQKNFETVGVEEKWGGDDIIKLPPPERRSTPNSTPPSKSKCPPQTYQDNQMVISVTLLKMVTLFLPNNAFFLTNIIFLN